MEITSSSSSSSSSLPGDLISALEQATLMAKQLPVLTPDPSHLLQIHAALHSAHRHLSLFLQSPPPVDEPMQIGDDEDEQQNSRAVEKVEGRLRECSIRNKRLKRPLSPSAVTRSYENVAALGDAGTPAGFDHVGNKLRSIDLIFQFHA